MFKNYLTTHFVDAFIRETATVNDAPAKEKHSLQRCAHELWRQFDRYQRARDSRERSAALFVAMTYLQDCREILEAFDFSSDDRDEIWNHLEILESRFADLFEKSSEKNGGQLSLIG